MGRGNESALSSSPSDPSQQFRHFLARSTIGTGSTYSRNRCGTTATAQCWTSTLSEVHRLWGQVKATVSDGGDGEDMTDAEILDYALALGQGD